MGSEKNYQNHKKTLSFICFIIFFLNLLWHSPQLHDYIRSDYKLAENMIKVFWRFGNSTDLVHLVLRSDDPIGWNCRNNQFHPKTRRSYRIFKFQVLKRILGQNWAKRAYYVIIIHKICFFEIVSYFAVFYPWFDFT